MIDEEDIFICLLISIIFKIELFLIYYADSSRNEQNRESRDSHTYFFIMVRFIF